MLIGHFQAGVWRASVMLVLLIRLSHVGTAAESAQIQSLSPFFFVIMSRHYPLALKFHDLGTTPDNGKLNQPTPQIEEPAN